MTAVSTDGSTTITSSRTFDFFLPPIPLYVQCPIVAQPGEVYSCSFAAVGTEGAGGLAVETEYTEPGQVTSPIPFAVPGEDEGGR